MIAKPLAALPLLLSLTPGYTPQVPKAQPAPAAPLVEILDPRAHLLPGARAAGAAVGRVSLPAQLDKHVDLLPRRQLGSKAWDISVAGDAAFKTYYATFRGEDLRIAPLGDLNRLRGDGIDIEVEPGVVYNFKAKINIFNPVRGSTLQIHPAQGTRGPAHDVKTGDLLDAVKAKAYVFSSDGNEYWLLHGTDVDAATGARGTTTSLLVIHEAGLSTKAWPVQVGQIPTSGALGVTFGDSNFALSRDEAGNLSIEKAD